MSTCAHAVFGGIAIVAGTGSAAELELESVIVAPEEPTAEVSCTWMNVDRPLKIGLRMSEIETGVGGAFGIVKVPVDDHAVSAAVNCEASP